MKKHILSAVLTFFAALTLSAKTTAPAAPEKDTYDYDMLVTSIQGVGEPVITDDFIVFTADNNCRSVGICFDFENYSRIHAFSLRRITDYNDEETSSWYFYVLDKPKKLTSISYKLVIDGLWTTDPHNSDVVYDWQNGVELSHLTVPQKNVLNTEESADGFTRFVCTAEPGQKVRIGGNFTNWDSWVYEMTEVSPGRYEINLPLPAGTYYYAYFTGLKRFLDNSNKERVYSADGKSANKIVIK